MPCRYLLALLGAVGLSGAAPCFAADARPEAQQEYWAQFDQRDWDAAIAAAEALVAAAREQAQSQPLELAEALALLGNAQLGAADHASAEKSFTEALELAERHGGVMGPALLEPLRGLGYTYAASGRHAEAASHLERAIRVDHRHHGLFDINQQGLLRQLAKSFTKLGRYADAERQMNYMQRVAERNYGANDPRIAPTLCEIADWYSQTAQFSTAREIYRAALEVIERKLGKSNIAAVEPLRGLADTYTRELYYSTIGVRLRREQRDNMPTDADGASREYEPLNPRHLSSAGEKALDRALRIIESQPSPPRDLHIDTLIDAGDWRQIKHQPDKAMPLYGRAAALLPNTAPPTATAPHDAPAPKLSFPVSVYYPKPWLATRNLTLPREAVEEYFVQVEFTVTPRGEVTNARVIEQNGTQRMANETLEAIRAARYRPRFVDGQPVETTGVTYREVFRARKSTDAANASQS